MFCQSFLVALITHSKIETKKLNLNWIEQQIFSCPKSNVLIFILNSFKKHFELIIKSKCIKSLLELNFRLFSFFSFKSPTLTYHNLVWYKSKKYFPHRYK